MKKPTRKIVQEVKPVKRIGWATLIDQIKLESLMPTRPWWMPAFVFRLLGRESWEDLFDLNRYSIRRRFNILKSLGVMESQQIFENLTPTVGFNAIAVAMTGGISDVLEISCNVHALGTGTTGAVAGNTELENEGARVLIASRVDDDNKALYTVFYGLSEAVGSWTEMGLFINADEEIADDGVLWDRTLLPITKAEGQSLTIDYEDTFSNA